MTTTQKVLVGIGVAILCYQGYKMATKPKSPETKSNSTGSKGFTEGMVKYHTGYGKVFKLVGKGFDGRWVQLADAQQPKAMDWYRLNDKWIWSKWNGKLDTSKIPNNYKLS